MSTPKPAYISNQPRNTEIMNSFDLMGNENLLRTWSFEEKSCGCTDSYHVTLTDARLLLRSEDATCCGCVDSNHSDSSIFLRDIAEIRESIEGSDDCCHCPRCCPCCGCCCSTSKFLEIRGVFGSKSLHLKKEDLPKVQVEIPAAIGNHKLVSQY